MSGMIGAVFMAVGAAMLLVGDWSRRRDAGWLSRSELLEAGYAVAAGLFATSGLFLMLPPPA